MLSSNCRKCPTSCRPSGRHVFLLLSTCRRPRRSARLLFIAVSCWLICCRCAAVSIQRLAERPLQLSVNWIRSPTVKLRLQARIGSFGCKTSLHSWRSEVVGAYFPLRYVVVQTMSHNWASAYRKFGYRIAEIDCRLIASDRRDQASGWDIS